MATLDSVSRCEMLPTEILAQLLQIEQQCCPPTSAARSNGRKEPNAVDEDAKGDGESLSVRVLLDEPDTRFCICYDETSPVIIACLWAKLQGAGVEDVVACLCEERAEWDKAGESHLVQAAETADPTMEEVYQSVIRCPRPFWDREVLKRQWRLPLDCATGKGYALVSRSIEEGNHDPERVQAFVHKAGALLRPANGEEVSRIANCASTEITSCSQIDMGGLIPAWATSYLSSVVVGKAVSWTDNLKRHCAARNGGEADLVPSLAQISKEMPTGWADHWDDTELVDEEQGSLLLRPLSWWSGES